MAVVALLMAICCGPGAPGVATAQSVTVTVDPSIELFRISDFDPSDTRFHPAVFTVTLSVPAVTNVRVRLRVTQDIGGDELASGTSNPFELSPGAPPISNRDLTEAGSPYELQDFQISTEGSELEEIILDTGVLPEGTYCFEITMLDESGGFLADGRDCMTVINPTNIELQRPGSGFGTDLPIVINAHPQFQWSSRAHLFRFEIAQAEPGDGAGEDVMEHLPEYRETISGPAGGFPGSLVNLTYPSSAEDLRRGQTYCWRVTAIVETSGGPVEYPSEIFCFRRWNPSDFAAIPIAEALDSLLPELAAVLGPGIQGMTPTGEILLDGVAIDPATVTQIFEGIEAGTIEVLSMEIE